MGQNIDKVAGKAKQVGGILTDDKALQAEGQIQEAKGDVKSAVLEAADKVKDVVHKAVDAVKHAVKKA